MLPKREQKTKGPSTTDLLQDILLFQMANAGVPQVQIRGALARVIREIEDARRLFCYKHVVKTVFVLQERLPACLTIARHSVCYSPTFSTSLPYCSSTNGWAVPMAGRFC